MQERKRIQFQDIAHFQPRQIEALEMMDKVKYLLYGGAAGGGKSYFIRWVAIYLLIKFHNLGIKGARVGIFCEDYPSLRDRHLNKIPFEFPDWLGTLNKSEHEFVLSNDYSNGVISFRNLDDPSKYLSSEFAAILVDELTRNDREIFDFLVMRLRWPGIEYPKFIGATNPGSKGHGWVKKLWIDKDFNGEGYKENEFGFVRAKYDDNQYLPESYGDQLGSLPEALRKAYKDGNWDVFQGQFFTEFDRNKHVIEPFQDQNTINWFRSLPTYCGMDYGYSKPSCILWGKWHDDRLYIYRELYVTEHTYEQLKDKVTQNEIPKLIYADPAIWAKKDSPNSGADKMRPLPMRQAMNDRIIGWNHVKQMLKTDKIRIFSTCKNLIRTLPVQVYDENKVEDLDTDGEDHAVDALRYLIATHKQIKPQKELWQARKPISDIEEVFGGIETPSTVFNINYK